MDGLVLGADSAWTISSKDAAGAPVVLNVYNHANKIINLHRQLPLALMAWGRGSVGGHSINWLAKELRQRFEGNDPDHPEWKVDIATYTVADVATRVRKFFFEEWVLADTGATGGPQADPLGLLIGGYGSRDEAPAAYTLWVSAGECAAPQQVLEHAAGAVWYGQPEALSRLILGFGGNAEQALINLGADPTLAPQYLLELRRQTEAPLIEPHLPIQDAIGLADFFVDTTIKFTRYSPGSDTVGGPIELAVITKHEGFKWAKRKHYYPYELNREA